MNVNCKWPKIAGNVNRAATLLLGSTFYSGPPLLTIHHCSLLLLINCWWPNRFSAMPANENKYAPGRCCFADLFALFLYTIRFDGTILICISPLQMLRLRESAVTSLTWEFGTSTTEVFSWSFRVTNTESIVWWVWLLIKLGYYSFLQPPAPPLVK